MTKELKEIKTLRGFNKVELNNDENVNKSLDIIEQALQRLEAIDNSNPSEALEIIRKCESSNYLNTWYPKFVEDLKTVENYILKVQEQEKVLKIIFEKGLSLVERDMIKQSENYKQYQIKISWWNYKPFAIPKSKEEFDTLKRYCK